MKSWIHRDCTDWAGVLYLTPNAPINSGTAFYKHKETGLEKIEKDTPKEISKKLDNDSYNMDKWEMVDMVGNKFNRLVLFRGTRSHKSMEYFGEDKNNGRLFQLFFFNEIGPLKKNIIKEIKKKKIAILFFTTSRYEYLESMLESFSKNVKFNNLEIYKIMIDDYPLRRNNNKLEELKNKYKIDELILNDKNLGYSLSWKKCWTFVPEDVDYIWHQEEDFIFNKEIDINDLIKTFEESPIKLNQITLKRQKWYDRGDFIDLIEKGEIGKEITSNNKKLIIHQTYFNSNPCLYPKWIIDEKYV
jgi:hypothetical protein